MVKGRRQYGAGWARPDQTPDLECLPKPWAVTAPEWSGVGHCEGSREESALSVTIWSRQVAGERYQERRLESLGVRRNQEALRPARGEVGLPWTSSGSGPLAKPPRMT